jgi:hypothetical protein
MGVPVKTRVLVADDHPIVLREHANILEKLGMTDRVELTRYAIRRGLVQP